MPVTMLGAQPKKFADRHADPVTARALRVPVQQVWGYRSDRSAVSSDRPPAVHRPVSEKRDDEYVVSFVESMTRRPAALVIQGEPGIGKTTRWMDVCEEARRAGVRVLSTRSGVGESALDFVGVDDLLADVEPEVFDALPIAQRTALRQVLVRSGADGTEIDRRAAIGAFRALVAELATRTPVLIGVDDVQWLDEATRDALVYTMRRVRGPVAVVVTERAVTGRGSAVSWLDLGEAGSVTRLVVRPMSVAELHRLVAGRTGRSLSRPAMARIAEMSGGNPYYAMELAQAMDSADWVWSAGLPSSLVDATGLHRERLDADVNEVLLAAASVVGPTVDLLAAVLHRPVEQIVGSLEKAENLGIASIEAGRVRFSHPLLPHIIYSQARPGERRRIHRAVAAVEPSPQRQARHLALAATTGDPEILRALDSAAETARADAAPATAAELTEFAIGLGGDTPVRRLHAARDHLLAGDIDRSLALLEPTAQGLPDGLMRAHARVLVGGALAVRGTFGRAVDELRVALADAAEDPGLTVQIQLALAMTLSAAGDHDGADDHVRQARMHAEGMADHVLTSQALAAQVLVRTANGEVAEEVSLRRAADLEQRVHHTSELPAGVHTAAPFSARVVKALVSVWTGRLNEGRAQLAEAQARYAARGSDVDVLWIQFHSAMTDIWLGRHGDAARLAEDMLLGAEQLGGTAARALAAEPRALLATLEGRESDARAEMDRVLEQVSDDVPPSNGLRTVLGFLELSLGRHAAAVDVLSPLLARSRTGGSIEIATLRFLPDLLEAAFSVGRVDEFAAWVDALEDAGTRLNRPRIVAVAARCRTMQLAARGELAAAQVTALRALDAHRGLPMPFELARTQLIVGQLQRRLRQKRLARTTLTEALTIFEQLGTPLWAARARTELARTAESPQQHLLTATEQRVAELVASGLTNKDVAAALYISPKTVEHNLGRVYRKLGIRNRTELGRQMDSLRDGPN